MSRLSYLETLLNGVGVEWKPIGTEIKTVTAPSKLKSQSYRLTGRLPIIDQGLEFIAGYTDEDVTPINNGEYIIFGDHSEHIKYVDFPFVQGADGIKILRAISANTKYIYYAFLTFYTKELSYKRHWSTAQQTLIPIPCPNDPEKSLAIQSEIVRVLDEFTSLTAELTAELTARRKQYNYYRDQLLSFDEGEVEWISLNNLCESISAGGDVPENSVKGQLEPDSKYPYPIYANATDEKGLYGYTDSYKINSDAVTISARGAKVGFHTIRDAKFTHIIRLIVLVADKNLVSTRYLNYVLDMTSIGGTEGGIPQITVPMIKKITVPIPFYGDVKRSLKEQKRIVSMLDKFDTLTTSITEGLPREIELRQKQYEYYRDLLFSFPKPEPVTN
ncbi:MAG TPA: restriction endonuclease subunit S [Morganella sp. (in: Bacteria)]|nr:restriction endonuclease subunit S [Morganella sp. (in: enterobacteria)]